MSIPDLVVVTLILSVAAYLQASIGFGLALVCLAFLPMIIPAEEGIALVTLFNLLITSAILFANRKGIVWKPAAAIAIGSVIGIPIGFYCLKAIDSVLIIRILGIVLAAIALFELAKDRLARGFQWPERSGLPVGIFAGVLGGAFNVGGPPVVAYIYSRNWSKVQSVAVMQIVFLASGLFRSVLMVGSGDYSSRILLMGACSIVPAIFATWLGKKTLDRIPTERLRVVVFSLILLIGLRYLVFG